MRYDRAMSAHSSTFASARLRAEPSLLRDLIAVLAEHPSGLRRWSVMRAMRARAEKANRDVSPKFEDEVERSFRRHCAGDSVRASQSPQPAELFYRPKEKAGEVWALDQEKARAFLEAA